MKDGDKSISMRFREIRKHLMYRQVDFGELFDLSQDAISAIETGKNRPTIDVITVLHNKFNVNLEWLILGKGSMFTATPLPVNQETIAYVPIIPAKVPYEYGRGQYAIDVTEYLPVHINVVKFYKKDAVKAFEVTGDSMSPFLSPGDFILFEEGLLTGTDGIYLINRAGNLIIKRVYYKSNGNVLLSSENGSYPNEELSSADLHQLVLIGKIVWKFQRLI